MQVLSIVVITTTLAVGFLAQQAKKENPQQNLSTLLAIGGIFGLFSAMPLRGASLPAATADTRVHWKDLWRVWRNRPFRHFVMATVIFNAPFFLAVPYYQVFNLSVLKLPESLIGMIATGYWLLKILFSPAAGRLVSRIGPKRALWLVSPLYILFFCSFPLTVLWGAWAIAGGWTVIGFADAVFMVATNSALYETVPPNSPARPAYFAAYNLASLGASALGALLAVSIIGWFERTQLHLGRWTLGQYHFFYASIAVSIVPVTFAWLLLEGRTRLATSRRRVPPAARVPLPAPSPQAAATAPRRQHDAA
jgi:MFS family permease